MIHARHQPPAHPIPRHTQAPTVGMRVYVAAGANLGAREQTLRDAFHALSTLAQTWSWRSSALYETPPVEVRHAPGEAVPAFLNAVFSATTTLPAPALLAAMQTLEQRAGREHKGEHRSRTLDLDLLALGDTVCADAVLLLPHPRLAERWFVLKPLCDLDPHWRHPQSGATAQQMLDALEQRVGDSADNNDDVMIGRGWCYADGVA